MFFFWLLQVWMSKTDSPKSECFQVTEGCYKRYDPQGGSVTNPLFMPEDITAGTVYQTLSAPSSPYQKAAVWEGDIVDWDSVTCNWELSDICLWSQRYCLVVFCLMLAPESFADRPKNVTDGSLKNDVATQSAVPSLASRSSGGLLAM